MKRLTKRLLLCFLTLLTFACVAAGCNFGSCANRDITPSGSSSAECVHSFGAWQVDELPTCTENGSRHKTCEKENCGYVLTEAIPAMGHTIEKDASREPTCLKKGFTQGEHCTVCGEIIVAQQKITKLGHDYGEWYESVPSTEKVNGELRRDCSRCDAYETTKAPLKNHDYKEGEKVAPTCSEYGYTLYICSDCGDTYKRDFVDKLPHDETLTTIAPSCLSDGYTLHVCNDCSFNYISDYIPAKGHDFGEYSVTTAATCTENGEQTAKCKNCDAITSQKLEAKGHSYVETMLEEGESGVKYVCENCADVVLLQSEEDAAVLEENEQLLDQETTFTFTVISEDGTDYIRQNLSLMDAYFINSEYASMTEVQIEYTLTAHESVKNGYVVSAKEPYENGATYVATLSGDLTFADYNGKTLTFSIVRKESNEVEISSDVVFLKALEQASPGYYPYSISQSEQSEFMQLTLQKIGELKVGDIILVGDAANADELFDAAPTVDPDAEGEEGIFFGKIEVIYLNDDSEYVCVLSCPDLTEVFEKLNVSSETEINFEDYPEAVEALEAEGLNSLYASDDFAIFLLSVNSAVDKYAAERDILADDVTSAAFKDKVKINKPDVKVKGTTITMTLDCGYKNEFKNKNGKKLGEFSINFTVKLEFGINISVDYKLKRWWFIPVGIEYFDISLKQNDSFTLDFNINFNVDYELEKAEQKYYYNKRSKKLHVDNCQYENITYEENIVYIDATELHEYAKKEGFSTCERCKPIEMLNRAAFVINTHEYSSGSGIYTIHCYNCQYVEEQILPENMQLYFCSYQALKIKLVGKKTQNCSYCKPQDRELLSFEDDLLRTYEYADWGDQVAKIKEWATGAGAGEYQEPSGIKLVDIHYVAWVATVNFEVRISLKFDFKAALNFHYEQSHTNVYGIRLQHGGVTPYSRQSKTEKATLKLSGSFNFRAGVRADGYVSIVGLSKWIRAGLYVEAGPYMKGRGIVYLTTEKDINNYAAAYFSTGIYVESSCYYKLFSLNGKATIIDKEFPIATYGYDKAYYCYTDGIDELDLKSNETLTLKDIASKLTVQYYDVINEKSVTEKFSLNSKHYKVKFSLKNGEYCYIQNGVIKISSSAPSDFTDELLITVLGNDSWKRYVKGSSVVYLGTRSIVIKVKGCKHDYEVESSKAATCTEEGFTTYKCTLCGHSYTNTTSALEHNYGEWVSNNNGTHTKTCSRNSSHTVTENCNYVSGICSVCSAKDTNNVTPTKYSEGLAYTLNDDGLSYSVSGIGTCTDTDIVIPSIYNEKPVTSIGYESFYGCSGLTNIAIPDSVTSIDDYAFSGCSALTSITIPNSVTSIGWSAFYSCDNLRYNEYGNCLYLDSANNSYFALIKAKDKSITSCTINDETKVIAGGAFFDCAALIDITIPNGVISFGDSAFLGCSELENITIPNSVTSIGSAAFLGCSALTSITIPNSVTSIGSVAFLGCSALTSITIPNSVTSIGSSAFSYCSHLASITISESVTSIGPQVFSDCSELESIMVANSNTKYHSKNNCLVETESKTLITGCKNSIIPDDGSVTSIGYYAFSGCSGLTSITIPNSITYIGYGAFHDCSGLTSISIPNSVASIGDNSFSHCSGLTSISIPNSVASIGDNSFSHCSHLASITIPDSVTSIGNEAFYGCYNLEKVNYTGTIDQWVLIRFNSYNRNYISNPLYYARNLYIDNKLVTEANISTATSINACAFYNCYSLTSVTIGNSVTSIGDRAFGGCKNLENITVNEGNTKYHSKDNCIIETKSKTLILGCKNSIIPDDGSVISIDDNAFYNCFGLTSITIPNSVTSIGSYAFSGCSGLTSVTIPDSVTSISGSAFQGCSGLTSITIPNSVTSIGWYAFFYCGGLNEIKFNGTVAQWNAITKGSDWDGYVPATKVICTDGEVEL